VQLDVKLSRLLPAIKWAQRRDRVIIKIDQPDCTDINISLTDNGLLSFE